MIEALAESARRCGLSPRRCESASELAERHDLTLYDAAYAAVAESRSGKLVTLDPICSTPGLGRRPSELAGADAEAERR